MRSDKVARLAGVTVRTVRHYHQIGLLAEPRRSANGWRDYSAKDLATLIRIHSFTELGIPLADIARALTDPVAAIDLLEQIDAQTEAEIALLTARRHSIAILRQDRVTPDLPASLARQFSQLRITGEVSPAAEQYEREQFALLSRFITADGWNSLAVSFSGLRAAGEELDNLSRRFLALPADAADDQWQALGSELSNLLERIATPADTPILGDEAASVLVEHQTGYLNPAQKQVVAWIAKRRSGG